MRFSKLVLTAFASALFFVSCSDDSQEPVRHIPLGKYDSGVLVMNQGGYGHGDASISYISSDFGTLENDIFSLVNPDIVLGDTAQDIGFSGKMAYIVLNNSNKIEIVNRYTLKSVATINSGLNNPRCITFYNGKAYVTNWGAAVNSTDDYVAIIDLSTNVVSATKIPVAEGPERILEHNGKLYVAHAGGYSFGNTISVINTADNSVSSINVGYVPNAMQIKDGNLWVSYGGKPYYADVETAGGLVQISTASNAIIHAYAYTDATDHVSNLIIDGSSVYYTMGSGIYKFDFGSAALPASPVFSTTAQGAYGVYSFAIKGHHFYLGDAGDYEHAGKVYIYSKGTGAGQAPIGTLESNYTVGIIPAGFYFNY